ASAPKLAAASPWAAGSRIVSQRRPQRRLVARRAQNGVGCDHGRSSRPVGPAKSPFGLGGTPDERAAGAGPGLAAPGAKQRAQRTPARGAAGSAVAKQTLVLGLLQVAERPLPERVLAEHWKARVVRHHISSCPGNSSAVGFPSGGSRRRGLMQD